MRRASLNLASLVGGLFLCSFAWAHDLSLTKVDIVSLGSDRQIWLVTPLSKLVKLDRLGDRPSAEVLDQAIRARLSLAVDGRQIQPPTARLEVDSRNDIVAWTTTLENSPGQIELQKRFYPEDSNSRTVVSSGSGDDIVLDSEHPVWNAAHSTPNGWQTFGSFGLLGVQHILSGLDHILFVLGLVLLGGSFKSLLKTVTAFTVAHSVTLSLAATRTFRPDPHIIEPLIALSIVAVASENFRKRRPEPVKKDYRPLIAFVFGLVHGFGFAEALANIGFIGKQLAIALVSFNIGVECGQAVVLALGTGFLALLSIKWRDQLPRLVTVGSVGIGMVGSYWFVDRLLQR